MRRLSLPRQVVYQLLLALVALFVLVPIWGMLRLAFDGALTGAPGRPGASVRCTSMEADRRTPPDRQSVL